MSSWGAGPTPATKTLVFFMSDGEPNEPGGSVGISSTEETAWYNFLASKGVNDAYAIGIGTGVGSADDDNIEPIAWNPGDLNTTHTDGALDPNVLVINSADLAGLIGTLVNLLPGVVSGNVLDQRRLRRRRPRWHHVDHGRWRDLYLSGGKQPDRPEHAGPTSRAARWSSLPRSAVS